MFYYMFFFDVAKRWQVLFQDPANVGMNSLIDLHHDIMFFLLIILGVVSYLLFIIMSEHQVCSNVLFTLPSNVTHNTILELLWTTLPSLILFMIAVPSFSLLYILEELKTPDVALKVIGHQWYWTYEYHDPNMLPITESVFEECRMRNSQDLTVGDFSLLETDSSLFLPTNTNMRVLITSDDVIHSWAVPSFGVKVDAVPGRLNQVFLNISREGYYYGQCSEICGLNHGFMPISVRACDSDSLLMLPSTADSDTAESLNS